MIREDIEQGINRPVCLILPEMLIRLCGAISNDTGVFFRIVLFDFKPLLVFKIMPLILDVLYESRKGQGEVERSISCQGRFVY